MFLSTSVFCVTIGHHDGASLRLPMHHRLSAGDLPGVKIGHVRPVLRQVGRLS